MTLLHLHCNAAQWQSLLLTQLLQCTDLTEDAVIEMVHVDIFQQVFSHGDSEWSDIELYKINCLHSSQNDTALLSMEFKIILDMHFN